MPRIEERLGTRVRVELRGGESQGAREAGEGPLLEGKYRLHGELGRGGVGVGLADDERARLRRQALDWLRADLAQHAKRAETDERAAVAKTLREWQEDPDLAGLRDTLDLALLPAKERNDVLQLWTDVAAIRRKAETPTPGVRPR